MYSAVLMLALTAGNEAIDFGKARCSGCSTYTTCSVVYSGCTTSCSTARHGLFNRCHGCTTSCTSAYSCSTACHSSCGGMFHRRSCSPTVCSTCTVYSGYTTCTSGTIVVPEKKKEMPKGEKIEGPKKEVSINVPATIVVSLPADARLIVDGTPTTSTSERRTLVTPVLENGTTYVYTMQAEVTREGRVMTQSQQVTVRGGETSNVQFNFSAQSVASR
jgi:uncharacterized protein (TIGR03000 family)